VLAVAGGKWLTAIDLSSASVLEIVARSVLGGILGLLLAVILIFIFNLVSAPYRICKEAKDNLQSEFTATKNKMDAELQKVNQCLRTLEEERIPRFNVSARGGHRFDKWEHEHLMWAELNIKNTSRSITLEDVEVRIVNLLDVVEKQDEPGKYDLYSLHKWNPIQIYWSERNAPAMQLKRDIPPDDTKIALIAFSDNSNGPPAVINTPTTSKPLLFSLGHKIDVEVSSPNSAIWKGEFYIQCHGKYVTKEFPYYTEATIEFETWNKWLDKKGITDLLINDKEDSQNQ